MNDKEERFDIDIKEFSLRVRVWGWRITSILLFASILPITLFIQNSLLLMILSAVWMVGVIFWLKFGKDVWHFTSLNFRSEVYYRLLTKMRKSDNVDDYVERKLLDT